MTVRETLATVTMPSAIAAGWNAVAQPMRLPLKCEVAFDELRFRDRLMRLAARVSASRDDAADETESTVIGQRLFRRVEQSVLARPAGPHHQNQHRNHAVVVDRRGGKVNPPPR